MSIFAARNRVTSALTATLPLRTHLARLVLNLSRAQTCVLCLQTPPACRLSLIFPLIFPTLSVYFKSSTTYIISVYSAESKFFPITFPRKKKCSFRNAWSALYRVNSDEKQSLETQDCLISATVDQKADSSHLNAVKQNDFHSRIVDEDV